MSARLRKLISSAAIVGFLGCYIAAVATLAERIPPNWIAQLVFFGLAGVCWGIPLIPLIAWMNKGR